MNKQSISHARTFVTELLAAADIQINGNRPWDIAVHNDAFYQRLVHDGALGFGESYVEKWWDTEQIDVLLARLFNAKLDKRATLSWRTKLTYLLAKYINFQTKHGAKKVANVHYDLGNDLFEMMLDPSMMYSCAYWKEAENLTAAQQAKLKLICDKLQLKPGLRLLDIGCGWGGLAQFAAEHYGVTVVGVTISKEQAALAKTRCANLPIEIRLQDYRDINESFDRIVSVGMFEHVGHLNYNTFMQTADRALKQNGLFLLHTIGSNESTTATNAWINKYIFPNGMLPSIAQIAKSIESRFVMEDWHNFGPYYDKTLLAWHDNFVKGWDKIAHRYGDTFYRMWRFYLLACAGSFRARAIQLWQVVLSKGDLSEVYVAPR